MASPRDDIGAADVYTAHGECIERAIAAVCRFYRLRGSDEEDFSQEARLFILRRAQKIVARFKGESSLDTYFTTIVKNHFVNSEVAGGRHQLVRLPDRFAESPACSIAATDMVCQIENAAVTERILCALRAATDRITAQQRLLLTLRFNLGFDISTVAFEMEMTPKAASNRISRLVRALHRDLVASGVTRPHAMAALEYLHEHGVPPPPHSAPSQVNVHYPSRPT